MKLRRLAAVLLVVTVFAATTTGFAGATTPEPINQSALRMKALGLVKGVDATGTDLALDANLSRAQLVTTLVRAFGQEANARNLNGTAAFADTANHPWASGYVAMAKQIITERTNGQESIGLPDGSFNPDGNVTAAQALAFIMKFLGVPADGTKAWPDNYLYGALNAGLISADDKALLAGIQNTPATRGLAFYLMDNAFYSFRLPEGGTVYTKFVDTTLPTITFDSYANEVQTESVTITGTVSESATVTANGSAVVLNAEHRFTYTMVLAQGLNTVTFAATDIAGNQSLPATVTIIRTTAGITGPATMPAGPGSTYTKP
jgi:hypothetical protein